MLKASAPPQIAILGDSHASAAIKGLAPLFHQENMNASIFAGSWCAPFTEYGVQETYNRNPQCWEIMSQAIQNVIADDTIKIVVLIAEWPNYLEGSRPGDDAVALYKNRHQSAASTAENGEDFRDIIL